MKKTVDASIIAVASQNETPTISVVSSVAPSAAAVPKVSNDNVPINSRPDVLLRLDSNIFLNKCSRPYRYKSVSTTTLQS
jgi:hypothetical protein